METTCESYPHIFVCGKVMTKLKVLYVLEQVEVTGNKIRNTRWMVRARNVCSRFVVEFVVCGRSFLWTQHQHWQRISISTTCCAFKNCITESAGEEMKVDIFAHINDVNVSDQEVTIDAYDSHTTIYPFVCRFDSYFCSVIFLRWDTPWIISILNIWNLASYDEVFAQVSSNRAIIFLAAHLKPKKATYFMLIFYAIIKMDIFVFLIVIFLACFTLVISLYPMLKKTRYRWK